MASPVIIDAGVVLPWAAIVAVGGWLIVEIRKDYKGLKTKVEGKVDSTKCAEKHTNETETEKETRIRIDAAVRADREARHGEN